MICCPCESDDIASQGKNAGSTSHYEYLKLVWPNVFRASRLLVGNASRVNLYFTSPIQEAQVKVDWQFN